MVYWYVIWAKDSVSSNSMCLCSSQTEYRSCNVGPFINYELEGGQLISLEKPKKVLFYGNYLKVDDPPFWNALLNYQINECIYLCISMPKMLPPLRFSPKNNDTRLIWPLLVIEHPLYSIQMSLDSKTSLCFLCYSKVSWWLLTIDLAYTPTSH